MVAGLVLLGIGGAGSAPEPDDGIDVYFRDADLGALSAQGLEHYRTHEPGESERIERAFPGAPPQIPHSIEDLEPISLGENECLECHHPENASEGEDVPLPDSHFEHAVLGSGAAGDPMVVVVKGYRLVKDEHGSRYNCTMCHTPQAIDVDTPPSLFVRETLTAPLPAVEAAPQSR
jgi:cytochrome c-type protein NapB